MQGRSSSMANAVSLLGAFLAAAIVLGILAVGMVLPVATVGGNLTKQVIGTFDALPAQFTATPMAQQSRILANDGKTVIATLYEENRQVVPLKAISPTMQQAQLAIEDDRFYQHGGIDTRGMVRAFLSTIQGERQGASTITQQYVKQTLINTALREDDKEAANAAQTQSGVAGYIRKIQEAKYAISLEKKLSKGDILQGYLNIVYYGAGAYGVESAAHRYFGISASKLNLAQSALLAGLVQQPNAYNPIDNPVRAIKRRNQVLNRMNELGLISPRVLRATSAQRLGLNVTTPKASCPASPAPYVCDYVVKWLEGQPSLGKDESVRRKLIRRGGLTIKTTIDLDLVASMRRVINARVKANTSNRGAAAAVVEPGTGKVLGIAQSSDYAKTQVNWAVDFKYGSSAGFQIGSTAKMFGLVTALKQGWHAQRTLVAPPSGTRYSVYRLGGEECGMSGSYSPGNAEGNEQGSMTLQHATSHSVNTAFLELAAQVGVCNEKKTMAELGLHTSQNGDYGDPNKDGLFGDQGPAGVILGADNASPLTLAASYATLAAGGTYCEPVPVESITSFEGKKYAIASKGCKKVVSGDVAYDATRILQTVFQGTARRVGGVPGRPSAGKTGTSDSSKQTWFAGYTPQRSAAVWYGTPIKPRAMPGIYGATVAGPLWRSVMASASEGLPVERFQRVRDQFTDPNATEVPDVTGRSEGTARRILEEAGFSVRIGYRMYSTYVSFGRVVSTDPGAQASSQKGSTVTLHLSRGKRPEPTRTPSPSATPSPSTPAKPTPSKTATPAAPPAAG